MRRNNRQYVYATLYKATERWLKAFYKASKKWAHRVVQDKPYIFAVPMYDNSKKVIRKDGTKTRKYPNKIKQPDSVYIKNEGNDFMVYTRKRENILTAVFHWDATDKRYKLYLSTDIILSQPGQELVNKACWLHLVIRRCIIDNLTQMSIEAGGYTKESADPDNICVNYLGLPVYFALIGKSLQGMDSRKWIGYNRTCWMAYLSQLKKNPTEKTAVLEAKARNAMKVLSALRNQ